MSSDILTSIDASADALKEASVESAAALEDASEDNSVLCKDSIEATADNNELSFTKSIDSTNETTSTKVSKLTFEPCKIASILDSSVEIKDSKELSAANLVDASAESAVENLTSNDESADTLEEASEETSAEYFASNEASPDTLDEASDEIDVENLTSIDESADALVDNSVEIAESIDASADALEEASEEIDVENLTSIDESAAALKDASVESAAENLVSKLASPAILDDVSPVIWPLMFVSVKDLELTSVSIWFCKLAKAASKPSMSAFTRPVGDKIVALVSFKSDCLFNIILVLGIKNKIYLCNIICVLSHQRNKIILLY
jgi:hypothetical protein